MKRVLIGHVPVDSAAVVIADPQALSRWEPRTSLGETQKLCEHAGATDLNDMHRHEAPELPFSDAAAWVAACSKRNGAVLGAQRTTGSGEVYGSGVAVGTGMGDGLYPVYAMVTEKNDVGPGEYFAVGRVAAIIVDCEIVRGIDLMWQLMARQAEADAEGN